MIDARVIKLQLYNNIDSIEYLLEKSGFYHIKKRRGRNEIRCARGLDRNKSSVVVKTDTLYATCYSTNVNGDIISIIQNQLGYTFGMTLQFISDVLNIDNNIEIITPFGGFYDTIYQKEESETMYIKTYDDKILENYLIQPSKLFCNDRINVNSQLKYEIGYDVATKRIIVPWRYYNGQIGGIMGRYNSKNTPEEISKWLPIIPFPKSQFLFGYSENYSNILNTHRCVITESEKGSMQLSSYGYDIGLSCGGSYISKQGIELLSYMGLKKIILALDEGLDEDFIRDQAKKIKSNLIGAKVGYIYDKDNIILKKNSKGSPTDYGKEAFAELCKRCISYV